MHAVVGLCFGILLFICLAGCSPTINQTSTSTVAVLRINTPVTPSATQTPTGTPSPSSTPNPTITPSPTVTPTSTATPHPMSILAERQRTYPGSAITIEATLEPGANYNRYYAWYLSDGLRIYGLLTVPFGEKPANGSPAIVFNHGYIAPEAYKTTERYVSYVDQLARHGYIVYKIDYRGNDRSQGVALGAYGDPGYTTDVLNAVSSLQSFPLADAQRIGMWGHSMGGFLTLRAMVISKEIKAGVIWAGVMGSYHDMLCCWPHSPPRVPTLSPDPDYHVSWRDLWTHIYGTPDENPTFWNSISANSYLQDISGPLQLHHDLEDSEVPSKFSQDLYQELSSAGKTAEYYEYPGDDHNITNYFNLAMQRTIAFFDKYLKDGG
jgi:uncharacterized protein